MVKRRRSHLFFLWFFFTFGMIALLCGICSSINFSGFDYLPMKDLVKLTQYGQPVSEEDQAFYLEEGEKMRKELADNPIPPEKIVPLEEIWEVLYMRGAEVSNKKAEWVQYGSCTDNFLQSGKHFVIYGTWSKMKGYDLTEDCLIDTGHRDLYGTPIYTLDHFWKEFMDAVNATNEARVAKGLEPVEPDIETGTRWEEYGIYMFLRTARRHCGKNPSDSCIKRNIRKKNRVGKPKKLGPGHTPALDVNNYEVFLPELQKRHIACGCAGYGADDLRHCMPVIRVGGVDVGCETKVKFRKATQKVKRLFK